MEVPLLYNKIIFEGELGFVSVQVAPEELHRFSILTSASIANNGIATSFTEVFKVDLLGELFNTVVILVFCPIVKIFIQVSSL